MGDFNINIQNEKQQTLKSLCTDLKSKQLISNPTTKYNTIIDHLYTNITDFEKLE